ncbi:MAG TPA: ATP-binding protein [Candidatus Polarisedimenticolia bacterium]|nr:ATP-binding protein [Candidatus Polarisedimenticolia bacterium]
MIDTARGSMKGLAASVLGLLVLLCLLGLDGVFGFILLSTWQLAFLFVLAALILWTRRKPEPRAPRLRVLCMWAAFLIVVLSSLGLFYRTRASAIRSSWESGSSSRLESRAERIRAEFKSLLESLSSPALWLSAKPSDERGALFDLLERRTPASLRATGRFGWTVLQDKDPLAWAGRTALARERIPRESGPSLTVAAQGASLILASCVPLDRGHLLVGEYLLQSPLERWPTLPLPSLQSGTDTVSIRRDPTAPSQEESTLDLSDIRVGRPRHGSSGIPATLYLPLKDPSGRTLILVTLRDLSAGIASQELAQRYRRIGSALLCLGFLILSLTCFRSSISPAPVPRGRWLAAGTLFLVAARMVLLPMGGSAWSRSFLGSSLFGCRLAGPFFRSPGDFFLSALCFAALSWWLARGVALMPRRPNGRRLPTLLAAPLLAGMGAFLFGLGMEIPSDARFEITRVEFFPPDWPRLLVQSAICLLFTGWLVLVGAWIRSLAAKPEGAEPLSPRIPAMARSFGFAALSVLLFFPLLQEASTRQRKVFYQGTLLPEVEHQSADRERILGQVLEDIQTSEQVRRILRASGTEDAEGTAYRLWATTRLKEDGLRSSLRLVGPDGRTLGRFGLNLPPESSMEEESPSTSSPKPLRRLVVKLGGFRRRVLAGQAVLRGPVGQVHRIEIHLLDESENLSFVGSRSENPYVELFHPSLPRFTNPELVSSEPLLATYDDKGRFRSSNLEGGPVLPAGSLSHLRQGTSRWITLRLADERYRALAQRTSEGFVLLGFLLPSELQLAGSYVRFVILVFLVSGALFSCLAAVSGIWRRVRRPGGGLSRRLLAIFLAASLLPLFSLAIFLHRFAAREFQANLLSEGLASLGAASRIVEDYLTTLADEGESLPVDDAITYWVSRVVDQDLNLYRGERLFATSTREIYASGILSGRLDPSAYRSLFLRGSPFALIRQHLGGLDALTLFAPLSPGRPTAGVLSLPLSIKEREIRHKRADVDEAILIVTVAMLLLLILLSDHVARRVASPIAALSAAARRIEAGDYDAEVVLPSRDEPALLIDSFNRMAASLRRQREDLRRRSDYIEKILLNATTGVISTDSEDRIVTLNPAARLLLRLAADPPAGASLSGILSGSPSLARLAEALAQSPPQREARWQMDLPLDERPHSLRIVSLPFRENPESPPGRILLLEDLTETVRSSRLEAWADMARRIAHEIKNPLTPIQLSADHLRRVHRSSDPRFGEILEQCLDTIQKQVRSLRGIAADFSDYARIPDFRPEPTSTKRILEEVLAPYRDADGVRFELHLDPQTPDLFVDPVLTRRALVNLVQNALEAMPEGGGLTIFAGPLPSPDAASRQLVRIRVRDTGSGMDAATRSRLFEPYFSTKASGTGLGLSIVRKSMAEQGGRVEVVSSPGSGTEVILDLPAAEG